MHLLSRIHWVRQSLAVAAAVTLASAAFGAEGLQIAVLNPDGQPARGALVMAEALAARAASRGSPMMTAGP